MEINLHITNVLPVASGVSKTSGNQWRKYSFVGETYDQYPKKIHFIAFNPKEGMYLPKVGDAITLSFDIDSRPFTGKDGVERWSTDILAWKIALGNSDEVGPGTQPQPTPQQPPMFSQPSAAPSYAAPAPQPQQPSSAAPYAPYGYQPAPQPQPSNDLPF